MYKYITTIILCICLQGCWCGSYSEQPYDFQGYTTTSCIIPCEPNMTCYEDPNDHNGDGHPDSGSNGSHGDGNNGNGKGNSK